MSNKILFIGVGSSGSRVADKAKNDYPKLFNSVAINADRIEQNDLSCLQIDLWENHEDNENAAFTQSKINVQKLVEENMEKIKEVLENYWE